MRIDRTITGETMNPTGFTKESGAINFCQGAGALTLVSTLGASVAVAGSIAPFPVISGLALGAGCTYMGFRQEAKEAEAKAKVTESNDDSNKPKSNSSKA